MRERENWKDIVLVNVGKRTKRIYYVGNSGRGRRGGGEEEEGKDEGRQRKGITKRDNELLVKQCGGEVYE